MNITEYLKNDINFGYTPVKVMDYIMQKANSQSQYVSWLTTCQGELVVRTWGFRSSKREGLQYTEIERKSLDSCVRRNCYLTSMSGYKVVYKPQVHASGNWYGYTYYYFDAADFNKWFSEPVMGICTKLLNPDYVFEIPKYKYCGYSGGCDLLEYLELYEAVCGIFREAWHKAYEEIFKPGKER